MKKLSSVMFWVGITLMVLAFCLSNAHAQPYTSRYFHYDQYFDAPTPWKIIATTVDGADNKCFQFGAGGAIADNRGGWISACGNENTNGSVGIVSGNVAGGSIELRPGNYGGWKALRTGSDTDLVWSFGGTSTANQAASIRSQRANGSDDSLLKVCGGGACTAAQGAYAQFNGNDSGGPGAGGQAYLSAGGGTTGLIYFLTSSGVDSTAIRWTMDTSGNFAQDASNGANIVLRKASTTVDSGTVAQDTTDIPYIPRFHSFGLNVLNAVYGSADANGTRMRFYKSRATDGTANTIVADADAMGEIKFYGADGASFVEGAIIKAEVNGTPGSGDMPTRIVFMTTPDGTNAAVNRWTIPTGASTALDWVAGSSATANSTATIRFNYTDTNDTGILQLSSGGNTDTMSGTRGAYITMEGQDVGGADLGGDINIIGGLGKSGGGDGPIITIRPDTADAQDRGQTCLGGGGACSNQNRGAYLTLRGNEFSTGAGDAELYAGAGQLVLSSAQSGTVLMYLATGGRFSMSGAGNGTYSNHKNVACEEKTIAVGSGAAGVATATNLCASGIIIGVGARVTQAPGGGATTYDIGCTGSGNLDQFCDGLSTALGTTCAYPTNGDGTNIPWVQKTATTMTITTDANVTVSDMKIRVCPYYIDTTAPTS